jgi:RHS repeat-associated protein
VPPFRFTYDAEGRLTSIEQSGGAATRIERSGDTITIISPGGRRTSLTAAAEGYATSIADPAGNATRCTYRQGLLQELADAEGGVYRFTYDAGGRIIRRDDPAGGFVSYASRRTNGTVSTAVVSALGRETIYERERRPSGVQRSITTCCGGRITETEIAADGTRTIRRPDGTVIRVQSSGGAEVAETTTPGGIRQRIVRRSSLDERGQTSTTEVNGRVYTLHEDFASGEQTMRIGARVERVVRFDERGRVIERNVAGQFPIHYAYDDPGHIMSVRFGSDAEARAAIVARDGDDLVADVADPLRRNFAAAHDARGLLVSETLPDGSTIEYGLDRIGNRTALAPPGRRPYVFRRDPRGLIAAVVTPSGEQTSFTYDAEARQTRMERADGTAIESRYDALGQLVQHGELRFTYDQRTGRRTTLEAPDGTIVAYEWDGFLLRKIRWEGEVRGEVAREYDPDFRIRSISVNGAAIERSYDAEGRLSAVGELEIVRDAAGRIAETLLGNVRTRQSYNGFGEIEMYEASIGERELFAYRLVRDAWGRIVEKTERVGGETRRFAYEYDARGRLAAVTAWSTAGILPAPATQDRLEAGGTPVARYEYDANGNRIATAGRRAVFDEADRIVRDGDVAFQHTRNGERSAAGDTRYRYDAYGNLASVSLADGTTVDYLLDGDGRRLARWVDGNIASSFLFRDLITPIAELDLRGEVAARFVFGERLHLPDYVVKGEARYRVVSDHLGSPRLVVDVATGAIVQRIDYDAFGVVERDTNPQFQPFGFAGGLCDPHSGLLHFGMRDYDPATGRWLVPDPALFAGNDTNLYAYVHNDPVNLSDPFGLWSGIWPGMGPGWHHDRNRIGGNICPPNMPDPYTGRPECPDELQSTGWHQEPTRSPTHGYQWSFRHESGSQCIYDGNGNLVTDPEIGGSYDYVNPFNPDGSLNPGGAVGHFFADMLPWIFWGN